VPRLRDMLRLSDLVRLIGTASRLIGTASSLW
jgi:hypothetical protein